MRRIVLSISMILFALTVISQSAIYRQEARLGKIFLPIGEPVEDYVNMHAEPNPFVNAIKAPDVVAGKTRYDLQSNYAMGSRMHVFPDGTIGATWTMGLVDPTFPDRGTGYNYFNGTSWGPFPTSRVEGAVRTGWPSYQPYGPSGEIICSHTGSATGGLIFHWRANKGTGPWSSFNLLGPAEVPNLLWPRMITSGPNNETIHVIVLTAPSANGGVPYQGLDGALVYSRSSDGGVTWDPRNVVLDGVSANDLLRVRADTYAWAAAKGETIAFVVGDGYGDGIVMKSDDNGDNWTKMLYYESIDKFMNGSVEYPQHGATDSYQHAVIDDLGRVHVAVGKQVHRTDGLGGMFYFPYSNGLLYWNETMAPLDTTKVGRGILDASTIDPAYKLAEVIETANDSISGLLTPNYYASLTSMPQLVFDHQNKILYAFYSAISPGYVNTNDENYRHIWFRFSDDYGVTWSPYTDLHNDIFHLFSECVYPSASATINNKVHLVYQSDNFIGGSNRPDPPAHGHVDNDIVHLSINTVVGLKEQAAQIIGIDQVYPNPARNEAWVTVQVDKPMKADISIVNLIGQQVFKNTQEFGFGGTHRLQLDLSRFESGVYFIRLSSGNQVVTRKIVVQ